MTALLLYPTHQNALEQFEKYQAAQLPAAVYPMRVTSSNQNSGENRILQINCQNPLADQAQQLGLAAGTVACRGCQFRMECSRNGYLNQLNIARSAEIVFATHRRAEITGLEKLAKGHTIISIHEDPRDILRPMMTLTEPELGKMVSLLTRLVENRSFATGAVKGVGPRKQRILSQFVTGYRQIANRLRVWIQAVMQQIQVARMTMQIHPPELAINSIGVERFIFSAIQNSKFHFQEQSWRLMIAAIKGTIDEWVVQVVHEPEHRGGTQKQLIGLRTNLISPRKSLWLSDATADPQALQRILNQEISNETPQGRIDLKKKITQIPTDIKRSTAGNKAVGLLRMLLAKFPHRKKNWNHLPSVARQADQGNEKQTDQKTELFRIRGGKVIKFLAPEM